MAKRRRKIKEERLPLHAYWMATISPERKISSTLPQMIIFSVPEGGSYGCSLCCSLCNILAASLSSVQFSSVQSLSHVRLFCSMPGLPVHHQLPEFTQTHVHRVGDAIQPSHPPSSSPSPPAPYFAIYECLLRTVRGFQNDSFCAF